MPREASSVAVSDDGGAGHVRCVILHDNHPAILTVGSSIGSGVRGSPHVVWDLVRSGSSVGDKADDVSSFEELDLEVLLRSLVLFKRTPVLEVEVSLHPVGLANHLTLLWLLG